MKKFGWLILSAVIATGGLATLVQAQSEPPADVDVEAPAVEETTPAAEGEGIDLAALTCRDYLKTPGDEQANLMIFMHGYMSGVAGTTTLDGPALATASDNIVDGCIDSPDSTLISQFEANR